VSENLSDDHQCHTLARHDIYECLILNIKGKENLDLLESFIVEKFEREKYNEI
jgi:hypothetical protein